MATAKLTYRNARVRVETPYVGAFVEALKAMVPAHYRSWQAYDKVWIIYAPYVSEVRRLTLTYFDTVEEINVAERDASTAQEQREKQEREAEAERRRQEYDRAGFYEGNFNDFFNRRNTRPPNPFAAGDDYAVLFVSPDAPREVVFASYKSLALVNHPDRGGTTEAMQKLNAAFDNIKRQKGWS